MLVDHVNRYLWSLQHPWMNEAGRLVYPLFAMVLGIGIRTAQAGRLRRLLGSLLALAVVSELAIVPLVSLGLRDYGNVIWTLAAGVLLVHAVQRSQASPVVGLVLAFVAFAICWQTEYGPPGAALVWAVWSRRLWAVLLVLALLSVMQGTVMPMLAPVFVILSEWLAGEQRYRSPRLMFGALYAGHFAVLGIGLLLMAQRSAEQ